LANVGRSLARHAPLLAALAIWVALAARLWFVCDDAFISFRYAKNLAHGHGLTFNLGESPPVEGYSNLLWVLVAAVCEAVRVPSPAVMPWISAAIGGCLLVGLWRRLAPDLPPGAAAGALLAVAASPAFAVWTSSGLETMAFAAALFALAQIVWRGGSLAIAVPLAAAAVLLRTEGVVWVGWIAVLGAWIRPELRRGAAVMAAAAVAVAAAQLAFRLGWHGDWLSNPARVKVGFGPWVLLRGGQYLAAFFLTCPASLAVLLLGLAAKGRLPRAACATAWAIVASTAFVGGDFLPFGRLLLPALPFAALAVGPVLARVPAAVGLALAAIGVLPAFDIDPLLAPFRTPLAFRGSEEEVQSEYGKWANVEGNTQEFVERGQALHAYCERTDGVVTGAVGAIGYYGDLVVEDVFGIVDRAVALRPGPTGRLVESPGHDKRVPIEFFLDRHPRILYSQTVQGPGAAGKMKDSVEKWAVSPTVAASYVPDFVEIDPVLGRLGAPVRVFLLMVRRVEPGEDAAAIWEGFPARRRALNAELRAAAPG
jgi:arabinofuranosyltransferase